MRLKYLLNICYVLAILAACQDEDALTPRSSDISSTSRFEFPQGNDTWDLELETIANTFGTVPIYTGFDSLDLNSAWSGTFSIKFKGDTLTDEHAAFYTNFIKNHVFAFLKPELCKKVLPNYIYLVDNFRQAGSYSGGMVGQKTYFDGLDFWAFSLRCTERAYIDYGSFVFYIGELYDLPDSPWEYKKRRTIILHNILQRIVEEGNVSVPAEFSSSDFNYNQRPSSIITNDAYYMKLGYPGQMTSQNYNFSAQTTTTDPTNNFIQYLKLGLRYTRDSVLIQYPEEQYPLIIKYYDITMNHMKNNYDWDIATMAEEIPVE